MTSRGGTANAARQENELGTILLDEAMMIHRELGPGLLESVYEKILYSALRDRGVQVGRQVPIAVRFRDLCFDEGFRADLILENRVLVEIKSVESLHAAHKKQLLTYLKLTGLKLGYLINFGEALLKNGIVRTVNGLVR